MKASTVRALRLPMLILLAAGLLVRLMCDTNASWTIHVDN